MQEKYTHQVSYYKFVTVDSVIVTCEYVQVQRGKWS